MRLAHDPKLALNSIAFPMENSSLGGAFDVPLELCAHTLYSQLVDFRLDHDLNNTTKLNTICITSLELSTVNTLCDIFSYYHENYSTSSWAIPLSPMAKLLEEESSQHLTTTKKTTITQTKPIAIANNNNNNTKLSESLIDTHNGTLKIDLISAGKEAILSESNENSPNSNGSSSSSSSSSSYHQSLSPTERIVKDNQITIFNRKPLSQTEMSSTKEEETSHYLKNNYNTTNVAKTRTISENSSNTSNTFLDICCLFCQKEANATTSSLIQCGNTQICKGAYCPSCIRRYMSKQTNSQKCPSCQLDIERSVLARIREPRFDTLALSNDVSPTRINNDLSHRLNFNTAHSHNKSGNFNSLKHRHSITDARVFVKTLDESCDGYEKFKTLLITFEMSDGIQTETHPKPFEPYKGTTKRAFLPEIKEHNEILAFYEKALKSGMLFKIELSRSFGDYRVHLNKDVLLKTSQHGGGRFGYPDSAFIDGLLRLARSFK
jgi:hypothetical protein